ncbi:MAG: hypothetical protein JWO13_1969 [Acidobacteriales bacterium]|nr:hypothetical protein [Terriglobales bacterium]
MLVALGRMQVENTQKTASRKIQCFYERDKGKL